MGVHDAAGLVALAGSTHEQFAPTVEGIVETLGGTVHHLVCQRVDALEPGRGLGSEFAFQELEYAADAFCCHRCDRGVGQRDLELTAQGEALRLVRLDHLCDGSLQRGVGTGQPDRLEVTANQLFVREIQGRCADFAVHHGGRIGKEILVVRAFRGAVREHQRRHAAAASATTALSVVRWRGRHVPQVHGVERRNVHAQFHGRRAEQHGQEPLVFAQLPELVRHRGQALLVFGAVAEAHLTRFATVLVDHGGVLSCFKAEVMELGAYGARQVVVQRTEIRVVHAAACSSAIAGAELDTGVLELPAHCFAEGGGHLGHQARLGGHGQHAFQQLDVVVALEMAGLQAATPVVGFAQFTPEAGQMTRPQQLLFIGDRVAATGWRIEHQKTRTAHLLFATQAPRGAQRVDRAAAH